MFRSLMYMLWTVWIALAIVVGTAIGTIYGWEHHGWIGASALGLAGFCVGGLVGSCPELGLEFLVAVVGNLI
jgi:hypothetical protein